MQITISFCTFLCLTYMAHVCLADDSETRRLSSKVEEMLKNVEENWRNANETIAKRGNTREERWLNNNQIRNKFTRQYNKIKALFDRVAALESNTGGTDINALTSLIEAAEADIVLLKTNQATIGDSLLVKCQKLDELLDPDTHCCKTGYTVLCVNAFLATTVFPFSDLTKGACPECPTGLLA